MTVRLAIGADHGGFELKEQIKDHIAKRKDIVVTDFGTHSSDSVDYPDYARAVGEAIISGQDDCGIVVCGSGVGATVAANKIPGIRAGLCHDTFSAHQGREDDDMNVLCMGARVIGPMLAFEVVDAWLNARFSGAERHVRRLSKVQQLEEEFEKHKQQAAAAQSK